MTAQTTTLGGILLACLFAVPASAQEDVRKLNPEQPETKVIEEKCLICHNRKRIDEALEQRRDMDKILVQMEKRGAVLTDQERQVMGVFGGKAFKDRK